MILKYIRGYKPLFQLFDFWGQGGKKTFQKWNARASLGHPVPQSSRAFTRSFNKHSSPSVCSPLKTEKQQNTVPASRAHHLAHCLHLVDWTSWSVRVTSLCSSALPDKSPWSSRIWRIINSWGQEMANNLLKWLSLLEPDLKTLTSRKTTPAFSLLYVIFSPLVGLLKARKSEEMQFIYDHVNNRLLWRSINTSWYSSWAGSVENA